MLRTDGSLEYPVSGKPGEVWVPEVFGNAILANGKLLPYVDVEPTLYRFRVHERSQRTLLPLLARQQGRIPSDRIRSGTTRRARRRQAHHHGSRRTRRHPHRLPPHGRTARRIRQRQLLHPAVPRRDRVCSKSAPAIPATLHPVERLAESTAVKTRRLTLDERMDDVQRSMGMLLNNTPWHAPITEKPVLHTTEIWELVNLTDDSHPIHLHLVRFQILDRRRFDTFELQYKGTLRYTGPVQPPDAE